MATLNSLKSRLSGKYKQAEKMRLKKQLLIVSNLIGEARMKKDEKLVLFLNKVEKNARKKLYSYEVRTFIGSSISKMIFDEKEILTFDNVYEIWGGGIDY